MTEEQIDRVTLSNGDVIVFDLYKLKRKEYNDLLNVRLDDDESSKIIAKVTGKEVEYLDELGWPDWRRIMVAFNRYVMAPVDAYPNSPSGSTSE